MRLPSRFPEIPRRTNRSLIVLACSVPVALLGASFPSFTRPAYLLVGVVGVGLAGLGLSGRVQRRPSIGTLPVQAWLWLIPVSLIVLVELATLSRGSAGYPTISLLVDPLLDRYAIRAGCYLGWLAGFWALIRR